MDAAEDLHQGGFAGAVLTDHGQHLAHVELDADIGQCLNPEKSLAYSPHFEDRWNHAECASPLTRPCRGLSP